MSEEIRSAIALIAGALVLAVCYIKIFLKGRSFNQKFMEKAKVVPLIKSLWKKQKSRGVIQRLRL